MKAEYRYTSLDEQKARWDFEEELEGDTEPYDAAAFGGSGADIETDNHDVTVSLAYRF